MGKEEWLTSRNKIAKLDEHLESWMNRLIESEYQLPIVDWLKNQIESYKVSQLLQYDLYAMAVMLHL